MFCNFCGKNQAVLHINQTIDEIQTELHLCSSCVQEQGFALSNQFSVADIVAGISHLTSNDAKKEALLCSFCGLRYEDFCMRGRFGCSECYDCFEEHLPNLFANIQGATTHKGKIALSKKKTKQSRKKLQQELGIAIEKENYERAAQIRDQLKEMDNEF